MITLTDSQRERLVILIDNLRSAEWVYGHSCASSGAFAEESTAGPIMCEIREILLLKDEEKDATAASTRSERVTHQEGS